MQILKNAAAQYRSDAAIGAGVVDIHSALKSGEVKQNKSGLFEFDQKSVVTAAVEQGIPLDFQTLIKYASSCYKISDDPNDYLVVPVPTIITDTPNRNGVSFPAKDIAAFSPVHGMPYFKTWIGKPTFLEHNNDDHTQAKGIILDAVMTPLRNYPGFYKITKLLSFDRTKDKGLYDQIMTGKMNAYSMGAWVGMYRCSYCKATFKPESRVAGCSHIDTKRPNFKIADNQLIYKEALMPEGFETSAVSTPAFRAAVSDYVNTIDPQLRAKE